jgi:hypothetical protein
MVRKMIAHDWSMLARSGNSRFKRIARFLFGCSRMSGEPISIFLRVRDAAHTHLEISRLEIPCLRRHALALLAFAAALAAMSGAALAGPDCLGYSPAPGSLGYQARTNSERCEGLYTANVSGGGIELVSLTFGPIHFGPTPGAVLQLKVDTPPARIADLRLIAQAIPAGLFYRMEARAPAMPFRLPTAAVIQPLRLGEDSIGIIAVRPLPGGRDAFIPVRVSADGAAAPAAAVLELVVRPQSDIEDLCWRIRVGEQLGAYQCILTAGEIATAGQRLPLTITPPAAIQKFTVDMRYKRIGGGREQERVSLFEIEMQ